MKAILIYTSKHGTTEKVAGIIRHSSKHQVVMNNLKKHPKPDLSSYDFVILGTSIHAGKISSPIRKFIKRNEDQLLKAKLALYMCCMNHDEADKQFELNFPETLREHAFAKACVGGEFIFEKMNRLERSIVKKVSGQGETVSEIMQDNLQAFIHAMEL